MIRKGKLQRIGLLSAVKTGFVVSGLIGLLCGIVWAAFIILFAGIASSMMDVPAGAGVTIALIVPFFFAILCAIWGATGAFLASLIYNITAGLFGGLEMEVDVDEHRSNESVSDLYYPPYDFYNEYR